MAVEYGLARGRQSEKPNLIKNKVTLYEKRVVVGEPCPRRALSRYHLGTRAPGAIRRPEEDVVDPPRKAVVSCREKVDTVLRCTRRVHRQGAEGREGIALRVPRWCLAIDRRIIEPIRP